MGFTVSEYNLLQVIVCMDLKDDAEVVRRVNAEHPSGTTNGWILQKELPKGAESNPWPCNTFAGYRHFVFEC